MRTKALFLYIIFVSAQYRLSCLFKKNFLVTHGLIILQVALL